MVVLLTLQLCVCRPEHGANAAEGHEVGVWQLQLGRVRPLRAPGGTDTRTPAHATIQIAAHSLNTKPV